MRAFPDLVCLWARAVQAGNGYDVVEKQVSAGRESLDRASKVMHDRAVLESEYAKGLAKISKAAAPLSKEELSYVCNCACLAS